MAVLLSCHPSSLPLLSSQCSFLVIPAPFSPVIPVLLFLSSE
ncbi:hypothetical protein [Wolbachia endosymbiont (group A) of Agelastica alni]